MAAAVLLVPLLLASQAGGRDFVKDARLLMRVAACGGEEPIPSELDRAVIDEYCARLEGSKELYRINYVEGARRFLSEIVPRELPSRVVYPFGGGDLLSALTTYPWADEITTISLEHAGDPRRLRRLGSKELSTSLEEIRKMAGALLVWNDNRSTTLSEAQQNQLPGELTLFLLALAVHRYRPVSLKYFRLEPDGSIEYLDELQIAAREGKNAPRLSTEWTAPDFSDAFSNSELTFVPIEGGPPRVHRHIAANLANERLPKGSPLLKHLQAKGRVTAMTKAASYLLWQNNFSNIRDYLLAHMEYMVSDSTGIPPGIAGPAGFVQETYGKFENSYLGASSQINAQFRRLWAVNPFKFLSFRYGYIDASKHNHLLITRRPRTIDLEEQGGEAVADGRHWRIWTEREVVHVWIPPAYRPDSASVVIYLHGYFVNADQAFVEHKLAQQFRASGRNALFIVPESPIDDTVEPRWKSMEALIEEVLRVTKVRAPSNRVTAVAHSGGYRTVIEWLKSPRLAEIALLDGIYFYQAELSGWLAKPPRRLVIVSSGADRSGELLKLSSGVFRRSGIPEHAAAAELARAARSARLVYLQSQYDHDAMITSGKVIPVVLALGGIAE